MWLDNDAFRRVQQHHDTMDVATPRRSLVPEKASLSSIGAAVYLPCPICGKLMNRVNFGRLSGVVTDVCHGHGIWFDRDELHRVLAFIDEGGLRESTRREAERQHEELRELRESRRLDGLVRPFSSISPEHGPRRGANVVGQLLWSLFFGGG